MKRIYHLIISVLIITLLLVLTGCQPIPEKSKVTTTKNTSTTKEPDTTKPQSGENDIDSLLQKMTLKEKVGQLFIIRPESLDSSLTPEQVHDASSNGATSLSTSMKNVLRDYPVGGIVVFGKNILNPTQLRSFIETLQDTSEIPLFISIDEEGGTVARLANHSAFNLTKYESAAAIGESKNTSDAIAMGTTIGTYLQDYGFNMDFAPIADVNTNPDNPIIGNRAFSSDASVAAEMAKAMATGLKQKEIIPVFKHFPGHGDTAEDSHSGIAISNKTQSEMENCEWLPYKSLTSKDCVMVGHIATPKITGNLTPATMSYEIINDILRHQLGFEGVIISDSLAMGAVTDEYDSKEAAVKVFEAGCDILLMPENFTEAFDAIIEDVEDGTISEQRLDESVRRILTLKQGYGLLN